MAQRRPWEVDDELWALIEPLLPQIERQYRHPGRKRLDDRKALCGILFVLYTGIAWEFLPQELGYGSGMTCWRRLRDWHEAGVWQRLHEVLLAKLNAAGMIDWSRSAADSSHVRALKRGAKTGPSPVDRARAGSKHHVITDGRGIPLAVTLTGGNRNDITQLIPLIDAIPAVRGRRGRPRRRPGKVFADRGYDHDKYRAQVKAKGIRPIIACRGTPHGSGLGVYRYVVEQTIALLHWFRRLRIRCDLHRHLPPRERRVENGATGTVTAMDVSAGTVTLQTNEPMSRTVKVPDTAQLDLHYAAPIYKAQGATLKHAYIVAGTWQTSRETLCVACSRSSQGSYLYLDRETLKHDIDAEAWVWWWRRHGRVSWRRRYGRVWW